MRLQKLLFEPTLVRTAPRVVQWWESRRLFYNAVVGSAGLGTLAYTSVVSYVARGQWSVAPWQLIVVYGVAANACYTLGSVTEIAVERWLGRPAFGLGPSLFRYGLVFSIGLTLFPSAIITFLAIVGQFFK